MIKSNNISFYFYFVNDVLSHITVYYAIIPERFHFFFFLNTCKCVLFIGYLTNIRNIYASLSPLTLCKLVICILLNHDLQNHTYFKLFNVGTMDIQINKLGGRTRVHIIYEYI